ncbi:hypothetical protein JZ751_021070, partial [Albula glossodonta]
MHQQASFRRYTSRQTHGHVFKCTEGQDREAQEDSRRLYSEMARFSAFICGEQSETKPAPEVLFAVIGTHRCGDRAPRTPHSFLWSLWYQRGVFTHPHIPKQKPQQSRLPTQCFSRPALLRLVINPGSAGMVAEEFLQPRREKAENTAGPGQVKRSCRQEVDQLPAGNGQRCLHSCNFLLG